jgi:peptidoglycan hydrolase CwlO-like protein
MKRKGLVLAGVIALTGALFVMPVSAQQAPDPGAGAGAAAGGAAGGGGGRGGRNFDPAAMQQRQLDRIKQALGTTDDEFKALQPKLEKVLTDQRNSTAGRGMGMMGRGGPGGPGGGRGGNNPAPAAAPDPATLSPVAKAAADLQTVLDNKDAKPEDIKEKLTALRDARTKARDELKAAQKDLTELLTQRQEAVLVEMGILE